LQNLFDLIAKYLPIEILCCIVLVLVLFLAFFSASEIGMMSLNRYRLKHLAKTEPWAKRVQKLLQRPDRLLGVILIGNTFTTTVASTCATLIGAQLGHSLGIALAPLALALLLLIVAETLPKTLGALKPERTAYYTGWILNGLLWILYPLVWLVTEASNGLLRLFGVRQLLNSSSESLSREELHMVVREATGLIPSNHQTMLLSILDLETLTVDDIMIPRNEVKGIDIDEDETTFISQFLETEHNLVPVYKNDLDDILGFIDARKLVFLLSNQEFTRKTLITALEEPYFVPEGTALPTQLRHFQKDNRRTAVVVDEYGDVVGILTLEDILEEIAGEYAKDIAIITRNIQAQEDGSYLVDGSLNIRDINRLQSWKLPTDGPKTLSGLIIEYLESIPSNGSQVSIAGHPIEVVTAQNKTVKTARISPRMKPEGEDRSLDE